MARPDNHSMRTSPDPEPDPKRRALRKGTRSCWDCKRRKVKCTFESAIDVACIACRRRGAACVSQDVPEEESVVEDSSIQVLQRITRVETLLEELVENVGSSTRGDVASTASGFSAKLAKSMSTITNNTQPTPSTLPPVSANGIAYCGQGPPGILSCCLSGLSLTLPCSGLLSGSIDLPVAELPAQTQSSSAMSDGYSSPTISSNMCKSFPSQEDVDLICKSNYKTTFFIHQLITEASTDFDDNGVDFVDNLSKIPPSSTHPVLVAQRMILYTLLIQYSPSQHTSQLLEDASEIQNRLVKTVTDFVNTNEDLLGCVEGLECLLLLGLYQENTGNLRRAWLIFRKAMATAQLIGVDGQNPRPVRKIIPEARDNARLIWFRIVYMDRLLSLMLGLAQGCPDADLDFDVPNETAIFKLERAHTLIAGGIIDRNKRDPLLQDFTATRDLDLKLLSVARSLPDEFWLPPNFANMQQYTKETNQEQMRLAHQVQYYNLIHLVHLPYLLREDVEGRYNYSRITCVNASREILIRFVAYRSFVGVKTCCRTADFFALMAGMTVLLAHIDSHRHQKDNILAHQRTSDRAMVEQMLYNMDRVVAKTADVFLETSSALLRKLLQVEATTAQGHQLQTASLTLTSLEEECSEIQLPIPYFGIVRIAREGTISKDWPGHQDPQSFAHDEYSASTRITAHHLPKSFKPQHQQTNLPSALSVTDAESTLFPVEEAPPMGATPFNDSIWDNLMLHPDPTASLDDWVFQGVDAAFFDSLMRGASG
ncbi:hypothetical protein BX600DRAFT_447136 [Xylariales sp. PMI_506]|nr:hypothetical protein BX600DRAFT_447136 [Xylariales sp. PMI_506]